MTHSIGAAALAGDPGAESARGHHRSTHRGGLAESLLGRAPPSHLVRSREHRVQTIVLVFSQSARLKPDLKPSHLHSDSSQMTIHQTNPPDLGGCQSL